VRARESGVVTVIGYEQLVETSSPYTRARGKVVLAAHVAQKIGVVARRRSPDFALIFVPS